MFQETVITAASNVYTSPRVAPLLVLGFASGLPLALTSGTLQAWATVENVPLQEIGFLTLVGSAYTLKFLWAPLVDRYAPPLLGRRRGWMLLTQVLLGLGIMAMGALSPSSALQTLALFAVIVAFLSATQDIAFDAYCTDVLRKEERGAGAAIKVMGYRLAMIVSGGLALILADQWIGWHNTYVLMGGLMLLCTLATFWAPEPEHVARPPRTLREAVGEPLHEFFSRRGALAVLLLIAISPKNLWLMATGVGIENLCGGLGTASFVGLLMALCRQRFSATQFALLSALSAVGRTYLAGPLTPPLVNAMGWPGFFLLTVVIALPGLVLLKMLRGTIETMEKQGEAQGG